MVKVVICGSGIAGLALARLLSAAHWEVVLVERAGELRGQGYMIDFFGPGYDAAEAMGLLPRLQELAFAVDEISSVSHRGRRVAGLDYRAYARALGGRLLSLMRGDLECALHEDLDGRVELLFGRTVAAVEQSPDQVTVTLSDGVQHRADLLVGADGIHSQVRHLVFGPEQDYLRYLGFHTAAYIFDHPELHRRLADRFVLTDTMDRQLGLYGIRDGRVAVFAAHRAEDPALPDDPAATMRRVYADLGWLFPEVLAHCPQPPALYYDQVAQIEMPTWSRGRVTLLGDSCQAVSLLAGQGASLAVAAAHVLAGELARVGRTGEVAPALAGYEQRWRPVVRERQAAGRRAAQWFLPSSRSRLLLRRVLLRLTRTPGLGRLLMSRVVGDEQPSIDHRRGAGDDP